MTIKDKLLSADDSLRLSHKGWANLGAVVQTVKLRLHLLNLALLLAQLDPQV